MDFLLHFYISWSFINGVHSAIASRLSPPEFSEHPHSMVVKKHEPVTLNCKADGRPSPTIEWYKDGEKVRNTQNRMILNGGSLFFLHVIPNKDTGTYWCVARNEVGKMKSQNASLVISGRPEISEHPLDLVVKKHEPVTLNCKADGNPSPTIEWYKDGEKVRNTQNRMILNGGSLFFLHVIPNKDTGTYWCVARNEIGKVKSRNASLVISEFNRVFEDDFKITTKSTPVTTGETVTLNSETFPNVHKNSALESVTKEPVFIFAAVAFIFLLSTIILLIVARKHVGWKKAVGGHINVELHKFDEVEKSELNSDRRVTTAKFSWLGEGSKSLSRPEASETYSDESNYLKRHHQHQFSCNRQVVHDYDTNNEEEAYYAEVGNPSMVTFGKKPEKNLTEAYATTTLINTYQTHRSQDSSNSTSSDPSKQLLMPNTRDQCTDTPFTNLLYQEKNGSCSSMGGVLSHVKVCDAPLMQRRFQSLRQPPYETKLDNNQVYL